MARNGNRKGKNGRKGKTRNGGKRKRYSRDKKSDQSALAPAIARPVLPKVKAGMKWIELLRKATIHIFPVHDSELNPHGVHHFYKGVMGRKFFHSWRECAKKISLTKRAKIFTAPLPRPIAVATTLAISWSDDGLVLPVTALGELVYDRIRGNAYQAVRKMAKISERSHVVVIVIHPTMIHSLMKALLEELNRPVAELDAVHPDARYINIRPTGGICVSD